MIPGAAGSAADGALSRTSGASVDLGDDYVDAGARAHSRRTRVHCDGVSPSPLAPAPHCLQVHTPHKTSCDAGRNLEQSCLRGRRVGSLVFFCLITLPQRWTPVPIRSIRERNPAVFLARGKEPRLARGEGDILCCRNIRAARN